MILGLIKNGNGKIILFECIPKLNHVKLYKIIAIIIKKYIKRYKNLKKNDNAGNKKEVR